MWVTVTLKINIKSVRVLLLSNNISVNNCGLLDLVKNNKYKLNRENQKQFM